MKCRLLPVLVLVLALLVTGCGNTASDYDTAGASVSDDTAETTAAVNSAADDSSTAAVPSNVDTADLFSDRDFETEYSKYAAISLNGDAASCDSDAVQITGGTVTITDEGTYVLSGTLNEGMIIINSEKTDKIQLVLKGVTIHSETCAPIYVLQADKVFMTLAADSVNSLSNGGTFTAIDDNNIDAVIFSKEDLTLNGSGSLTITSPGGHGIVSKDELTVTGGSYEISCASHGISGKDNVCVAAGSFTVTAGKDGIRAENDEDTALGFVYIQNGVFDLMVEGDGLSSSAYMRIDGGQFNILSGGGSENGEKQSSDSWGNFMGGGPGDKGGRSMGNMGSTTETEADSTSIKGIKASADLTINDGSFTINSADDAVHSDASVKISGGTFQVATGDDGFHAEDTLTIAAGTIAITESYEGLEGLHIQVSGGDIDLTASDDGLNAAGGTDQSGFGGRDNGNFGRPGGMGSSSNGSIVISGGNLYIKASGDGIDANGTLTISGGHTIVAGPTQGDTATLDYDTSAVITGGTFIGTGASGMAQTFSNSEQGVIAVSVGSQTAGTHITLTDSKGNELFSHTPELSFGVVILSSPELIKGETYSITVGEASGEFAAA